MLAVVKRLLPGKTEDIAGLQADIGRVKAEAAAACAEIEEIQQQRALAPSYEAAVELDERYRKLQWVVSHADAVLPELEARLAQALAARHQAMIARHRAIGAQVYQQLRAALIEAGKAQALALQARADAVAEIGEGQAQLHLPVVAFMGLLTPDLLQLYFDQMDRVMAPQPKPKPVAAAPRPVSRPKSRPKIEISPGAVPARAARQPLHDTAPADDGERLVTILRNGVELVDGRQCAVGDVVRVSSEKASQLLRSGAAEEAK